MDNEVGNIGGAERAFTDRRASEMSDGHLPAGIILPPEKEVRPLSGPFGLDEDLAILKDMERTQKDNMKRGPAAIIGLLFILVLLCVWLVFMTYSIAIYKSSTIIIVKGAIVGVWALVLVSAFPIEVSSVRADLLEPMIKKFSKEWNYGPRLLSALDTKKVELPARYKAPDEPLLLSPMQRESFYMDFYRKTGSSFLVGYMVLVFFGVGWVTFMFTGRLVPTLRALAVAVPTSFAVFYIVLNFKYNFATRLYPKEWFFLRNGVKWAVVILVFAVLVILIWSLFTAGSLDGAVKAMEADYFLLVLFAVPAALTDLIVSDSLSYLPVIIPILLWTAGYISYRRLQRTDVVRARVKLAVMGRYKWGIEDNAAEQKDTVLLDVGKKPEKKTVRLRSEAADWSSIDEGPGPKVLLSKTRLYELNTRAKYIVVSVVITLLVISGIVSTMLNSTPSLEESGIIVLPVAAFLIISMSSVRPGKEEGERKDVLRLLPVEGKDVLNAMMEPMLKYSLLPYLILTVSFFVAYRISDPAFLIFFLAAVPSLFLAFAPFIAYHYVSDSMGGFFFTLLYIGVFALMAAYFDLATLVIALPLWVFMVLATVAILPFFGLSRRVFIRGFQKRYLARPGWRMRKRLVAVMVGILIIVATIIPIGLTATGVIRTGMTPEKIAMTVSGMETVVNTTVEYDGSVIVPAGGSLEIRNSLVRFKVAAVGETQLRVYEGASLTIVNSTLTADSYFKFRISGYAYILNSTIMRTWGSDIDAGIQVFSDDVTIYGTVVEDGMSHGIDIEYCSPVVDDCIIQKNDAVGLYLSHSNAVISNNTIRNNLDGLYVSAGAVQLINNTIQNNTYHGLVIDNSKPYLFGNRFYDNKRFAIVVYGNKDPILADNQFANNKLGVMDHRPRSNVYLVLLISALPSTFIVMFPFMYLSDKREKMFRKVKTGRGD